MTNQIYILNEFNYCKKWQNSTQYTLTISLTSFSISHAERYQFWVLATFINREAGGDKVCHTRR